MFTGIVEKSARVIGAVDGPGFRRLTLASSWNDIALGESIAVNGACLTVAEIMPGELGFDIVPETLGKTNLGILKGGDEVHVERALRIGDRLDGHFVQGHIDGVALLIDTQFDADETRLVLEAPLPLAKFLAPKGSVTLDGVSLTLAAVRGIHFEVVLIPTTIGRTKLARRPVGWAYNLETDVLAKTIVNWLEQRGSAESSPA